VRVGFVGIGAMGWPMAANLTSAGHAVTVVDADPGRASAFATEHDAEYADGPGFLPVDCDVVVTMLPTSAHVVSVVDGLGPVLRPGLLVIDMTSGVPARTRVLAEAMAARGVGMVDCPVSGGVARARTGELAILAGGSESDLDRAAPLLDILGSSVHRCGLVGAGQAMKALNNLVSAGGLLLSVEALLLGRATGLEPGLMVDVLNSSTGMNSSTRSKLRQFVLSGSYDSGFALDLMVKDLGIALDLEGPTRPATPLAALCVQLWRAAGATLGPGHDHTEVARFAESLAGISLVAAES
jgi:3-hydroxyisobutyrate dehydrogenase